MSTRTYWRLAWLCLLLAIPVRLYFFVGMGLGDDMNESLALMWFKANLRLNPDDFLHYRVVNIVVRGLAYRLFGVSEAVFIAPILIAALGTHAVTMFLARDLLGERAAFLTSLLALVTPYETLASTANVPDYFHAFFGTAAALAVQRGVRQGRSWPMVVGAVCIGLGMANRVATFLLFPVLGFVMLLTRRRVREWIAFWATLAVLLGIACFADYRYSGSPFRWLFFNSGGGTDVTSIIGVILKAYPRYLFLTDDWGNWMFGITGWCALGGALLAAWRTARGRAGPAEVAMILGFFLFGGLFEFLPHRITLTAYYSHPRIFRYLVQLAPVIYLCGAYLLERTLTWQPAAGVLATMAVVAVGAWQTPLVSYPLRDANRDSRALLAYLHAHEVAPGKPPITVYSDIWHTAQIQSRYDEHWLVWGLKGVEPGSNQRKVEFLRDVRDGLVVTGGATLPWYSSLGLIVTLSVLHFTPPSNWQLLYTVDGPVTGWRRDPLQIWRVTPAPPTADSAVSGSASPESRPAAPAAPGTPAG